MPKDTLPIGMGPGVNTLLRDTTPRTPAYNEERASSATNIMTINHQILLPGGQALVSVRPCSTSRQLDVDTLHPQPLQIVADLSSPDPNTHVVQGDSSDTFGLQNATACGVDVSIL